MVASIAGAQGETAVELGLAMLGFQFAIGAANDFKDAAADSVSKPGKPVPSGLITRPAAAAVAAVAGGAGLAISALVGLPALILGAAGLGDGLVYDLRLKGTALAWVPFAAGVGLLPVYAWWGATGGLPPALAGVVVLAFGAGSTLALANAYADVNRDRAASATSVATALGPGRTLAVDAALLALVQIIALATTIATAEAALLLFEAGGCGLGWLGVGLAAVRDERARPLVWELQAIGLAVLGLSWLAALNSAGLLRN